MIGEEASSPKSLASRNTIYKVGGTAALTIVVFMNIQMAVFFSYPPPTSVPGWFALFHNNPLAGLIDMDLLLTVDYVLMVIVFVALWSSLRQFNQSFMTLALILQLISITTYFSSTTAFQMLSLSNQYTTATTDTEKSVFLAAGQVMLTNWQGTAFDVSYVLGSAATVIVSFIMLKSHPCLYSRTTAYFGIAAGVLMFVPPTAGPIGLTMSVLSVPPTAVWLVLMAKTLLFKLGPLGRKNAMEEKKEL